MAYEHILAALADPTRRAVLDRLRKGPLPVGKIAEPLPVTRPAVSQHLKVLLDAGLVTVEGQGTRNLYALAPGGAGPLVAWLGELVERRAAPEGGIRREITVPLSQPQAWAMLTDGLTTWWPVGQVSVSARESGALPMLVELQAIPGGQCLETTFDGTQHIWAEVAAVAEGTRLEMDWHLATPGRVVWEVTRDAEGARISVTHSDAASAEMWDLVFLERFGAAARAGVSNF
jgi:YD repeat-containing protein